MKWIGFCLVLLGSAGVGFSLVGEYSLRIQTLSEIKTMIHYINDRVLYECVPLAEAFKRTAARMNSPFREFLEKVADQMEEFCGEDVSLIWKGNAELLKNWINKQDFKEFQQCMGQTGFMDVQGQSQALKVYEQSLELKLVRLMEQKEEKCKLYQTLGIMSGVFVCILLF